MNKTNIFPKITNEIHALSIKGNSAKEITAYLNRKGFDIKEKSIQRKMKILQITADRIDRSRKMAEILASHSYEGSDAAGRNIEILHAVLSEMMLSGHDGEPVHISPHDAFSLARSVECLVRAEVQHAHPKKKGKQEGISTEIIDEAMDILGIGNPEHNPSPPVSSPISKNTEQNNERYVT